MAMLEFWKSKEGAEGWNIFITIKLIFGIEFEFGAYKYYFVRDYLVF